MTSDEDLVARAAQIGSRRAAEALGALVGQPVTSSSAVQAVQLGALPSDAAMVHTRFDVQGFPEGHFVAAFPPESIRAVRALLAPGMEDTKESRDLVAIEVSNICVSQFLSALGDMLDTQLVPSPPLLEDPPEPRSDDEYLIHTAFRSPSGGEVHGTLRFSPPPGLMKALRAHAGK